MVVMIIYDDRPICNSALKGFVMAISAYVYHTCYKVGYEVRKGIK